MLMDTESVPDSNNDANMISQIEEEEGKRRGRTTRGTDNFKVLTETETEKKKKETIVVIIITKSRVDQETTDARVSFLQRRRKV